MSKERGKQGKGRERGGGFEEGEVNGPVGVHSSFAARASEERKEAEVVSGAREVS